MLAKSEAGVCPQTLNPEPETLNPKEGQGMLLVDYPAKSCKHPIDIFLAKPQTLNPKP